MPPKNKNKKGAAVDDDDFEAALKEMGAALPTDTAPPAPAPAAPPVSAAPPPAGGSVSSAAQAFLAASGLAAPGAAPADKKKKKKKKAGGGNKDGDDDEDDDAEGGGGVEGGAAASADAPPAASAKKDSEKKKKKADEPKISAAGRLVQQRLEAERLENERVARLQAEEEARVQALDRADAEKAAAEAAAREKVRLKKKEKVDKAKAEGTYLTDAQKKKKAMEAEKLKAMEKAGLIIKKKEGGGEEGDAATAESAAGASAAPKKKVVYEKKKKQQNNNAKQQESDTAAAAEKARQDALDEDDEDDDEDTRKAKKESRDRKAIKEALLKKAEEEAADNWDESSEEEEEGEKGTNAEEEEDDDEASESEEEDDDEEEDLITKEKAMEQARLKRLGLEREKRQREEEAKLAELRKLEEEASLKALMAQQLREEGKKKREEKERANVLARSRDNLRSPVVVIMGHVDTGKTKLLDNIRRTNVQEGEAGGITQQIGATYFEPTTLAARFKALNEKEKMPLSLPGMLVIDTPGHESFSNLRSRGSSLCDVAILVVDLMHGLEQQTIESLNMLKKRGTPFVVAVNKVDRCYAWKKIDNAPIRDSLAIQEEGTKQEFHTKMERAKVQLAEQGINSNIYWDMGKDDWMNSDFVPLVPTSAITGEGVQDLLWLLCKMSQDKLWRQLMWCANLQCTVLEVKAIDGLGMTVDVLVVNGTIREGDRVVMCTLDGPVVTELRGLLTPPPSREMRVKSEYVHHKEVKGALGVKLIGNHFDRVLAGTPVMVLGPDDEEEDIKAEVMADLQGLTDKLKCDKRGVMVQASTLGSLEALLQFLREDTKPPIPVSFIGIGPIYKKDVVRISTMLDKGEADKVYATILAFDVPIDPQAKEEADKLGVKIFTAPIIYHLFDAFTRYMDEIVEKRRADAAVVAVFPVIVKILPQHIFNQKDPIIVGMEVLEGILKVGTPLCIPALEGLNVGVVQSIEMNGKEQQTARKGSSVAVKIINETNPSICYGRQFDSSKNLYSTLTRQSIDALKLNYKDALEQDDWKLVIKLKKVFNIL